MKVLVFDTETTGLITNYGDSLYDSHKYPHIVQLSWLLFDTESHIIVNVSDHILKVPNSVEISEESSKIHGITKQISMEKGENPKLVLQKFANVLKQADRCVCHNIRFDKRMVRIEFIRNKMMDYIYKGNHSWYCTMYNSTDICKMPRYDKYIHARQMLEQCKKTFDDRYKLAVRVTYMDELEGLIQNLKSTEKVKYKPPKLIELHKYLFGTEPSNLHNSMIDVYVCFRCYYKIQHNADIIAMYPELNNHYKKICGL